MWGTSLALVRAYVLAGADGDHRRAFARYERELRDIWVRNHLIRALPGMPWRGLVAAMSRRPPPPSHSRTTDMPPVWERLVAGRVRE